MNEREAALDVTTSGWWEVCLFDRGALERRRHFEPHQLDTARAMINVWLGTSDEWDERFGEVGLAPTGDELGSR